MTKLRQEAYADLQAQLEHYNHEFITRMRYEETMGSSSSSSPASSSSSSSEGEEDGSIEELVHLFDSGTVKDYSQLIEWESFKVSISCIVSLSRYTKYLCFFFSSRTLLITLSVKVNMVIFSNSIYLLLFSLM